MPAGQNRGHSTQPLPFFFYLKLGLFFCGIHSKIYIYAHTSFNFLTFTDELSYLSVIFGHLTVTIRIRVYKPEVAPWWLQPNELS